MALSTITWKVGGFAYSRYLDTLMFMYPWRASAQVKMKPVVQPTATSCYRNY